MVQLFRNRILLHVPVSCDFYISGTVRLIMSEHDFSLTTFSSNGKLVQIEHAINAVNSQGRPALGIRAKNGVVLVTEKKTSHSLLVDDLSLKKVELVGEHIGVVYSGMPADYRIILTRARKEAQKYWRTYLDLIPVRQLVKQVAAVVQEFTQSGGVRPFGVSLLICGYDFHLGHQLYQVDPSGSYFGWKATALGKDSANAKTFLEKRYQADMEIEDAVHTALLTLKEGFEGAMDETNVEIGILSGQGLFKCLSPSDVKDYLSEVE